MKKPVCCNTKLTTRYVQYRKHSFLELCNKRHQISIRNVKPDYRILIENRPTSRIFLPPLFSTDFDELPLYDRLLKSSLY